MFPWRATTLCAILVALLAGNGVTQAGREVGVVLLTPRADDPRVLAAREAVDFWNRTFTELGLLLRLKEPRVEVRPSLHSVVDKYVKGLSAAKSDKDEPPVPRDLDELHKSGGDVVIFHSEDEELISWGGSYGEAGTFPGLIVQRPAHIPPLSLPNTARNNTAHELGHVLGLMHNADDATLMCGRPAECRPARYESPKLRFFALTDADRATLKRFHGAPKLR
jgi:hypothetical protein